MNFFSCLFIEGAIFTYLPKPHFLYTRPEKTQNNTQRNGVDHTATKYPVIKTVAVAPNAVIDAVAVTVPAAAIIIGVLR